MRTAALSRLVTGLALIAAGSTVAAQEWRDALPGEALYEAKQRIETAELNAAVDPLKKASVHLQHADRRVNEMRESAARGNTVSTGTLSDGYTAAMRQAEEQIRQARRQGRDTSRVLQEVDKATQKHTEVLTGLLEQVPEQAVPAIRQAREVSLRGRQTALEQLRGSDRPGPVRRDDRTERGISRDSRAPNEDFPDRPGAGSRGNFPGSPGDSRGGLPGSTGGGAGSPAGGGPPGR